MEVLEGVLAYRLSKKNKSIRKKPQLVRATVYEMKHNIMKRPVNRSLMGWSDVLRIKISKESQS